MYIPISLALVATGCLILATSHFETPRHGTVKRSAGKRSRGTQETLDIAPPGVSDTLVSKANMRSLAGAVNRKRNRLGGNLVKKISNVEDTMTKTAFRPPGQGAVDAYWKLTRPTHATQPDVEITQDDWLACEVGTSQRNVKGKLECVKTSMLTLTTAPWMDRAADPCMNLQKYVCGLMPPGDKTIFAEVEATNSIIYSRAVQDTLTRGGVDSQPTQFTSECERAALDWRSGKKDLIGEQIRTALSSAIASINHVKDDETLAYALGRLSAIGAPLFIGTHPHAMLNDTSKFGLYMVRDDMDAGTKWSGFWVQLAEIGTILGFNDNCVRHGSNIHSRLSMARTTVPPVLADTSPLALARTAALARYTFDAESLQQALPKFHVGRFMDGLMDEAGLDYDPDRHTYFVVRSPGFVEASLDIVKTYAEWADYLKFSLASFVGEHLLPATAESGLDNMGTATSSSCYRAGAKYFAADVSREFGVHSVDLNIIDKITKSVKQSMQEIVGASTFTPETKELLLDKLTAVEIKVRYEQQFGGHVPGTVPLGSMHGTHAENVMMLIRSYAHDRLRVLCGFEADGRFFENAMSNPAAPGAAYSVTDNTVYISPGIIVPAYVGTDTATQYGRAGFTIAHEIAHAIAGKYIVAGPDGSLNAERDRSRAARELSKYHGCLNRFYSSISFTDGRQLPQNSAKLMIDENAADMLGLEAAFRSYLRESPGSDVGDFFIAYASLWCERGSGALRKSPHAPAAMRANVPSKNIPAFDEYFGCNRHASCRFGI